MTTPLGRSNTPSLFGLHATNRPQTFCTILPTPKGIIRCAYTINPLSTIAFATAPTSAISKNLHIHLWSHPMPVHLLWQQNQPPLALKRSIIDRRQDCRVRTVEIRPKEGELWCFLAYECSKIHRDLTNPLQINVWPQPNHPKLLQPLGNT
jgi:hypothetical protein